MTHSILWTILDYFRSCEKKYFRSCDLIFWPSANISEFKIKSIFLFSGPDHVLRRSTLFWRKYEVTVVGRGQVRGWHFGRDWIFQLLLHWRRPGLLWVIQKWAKSILFGVCHSDQYDSVEGLKPWSSAAQPT